MARIPSGQIDEFRGRLIVDPDYDGNFPVNVYVYYLPSPERLRESGKNTDDVNFYKKKILEIFGQDDFITIYPINTVPNNDFMQPKYAQIESITLTGFDYGFPETIEEVEDILENLPSGFVKNYDYGLGFQKDYRFIINAIEEIKDIKHLVISKEEKTHIGAFSMHNLDAEKFFYTLNYNEYEIIRKGIDKISRNFQSEGRIDKSIFAYNGLLNTINPTQYPEKYRSYKRDTLFKFISANDMQQADLSAGDQKEIVSLISKNKKNLSEHQPKVLMKLHDDIELVTLENLIEKFEEMLNKDLSEGHYQKLFNENPFILNLAFGYPIIKFSEQACVGGRTFSGIGEKITDFLVKNNLTNNTALIEIKTPSTKLLNKKPYRESVYAPSPEFSGSINQLLDQKYKFQKEIVSIKGNSRIYDLESYSVNCVLIIGKTPEEIDQKKSFELIRGNSKDIEIITFDELLEKLKQLHIFLSSGDQI
jgi:hypothetical protein